MGDKDTAFCELLNLECGLFLSQTVFDHLIGNVGFLLNEFRDVHSGIDEEVFSVPDHAIDNQNSTKLGDSVIFRRKTCGFEIEYTVFAFRERSVDVVPAITWISECV